MDSFDRLGGLRGRLPPWCFPLLAACGTALISAAIYLAGDGASAAAMLYLWVAVYSFAVLGERQALLQLVLIAAAYGGVLLARDPPGAPLATWLATVGTLAATGAVIRLVRGRTAQLIADLADAARTDPLTGLLNRRGFEERFDMELERARRTARPLSVVMGDIDRFKDLNDRLGHLAGDRALERLSAVVDTERRRIDVVARIGGEEFALIAPETDEHGAYVLAERLRTGVRDAFADEPQPLTLSFGVAAFPRDGATRNELLAAGDRALYVAKQLGRDCSVIYSAEVAGTLEAAASREVAQRDAYLATMLVLAEALDLRETGSAKHCRRVGRFAETTARELGLPEEVAERVRIGGVLRDVGKLGVPDSVLHKPGPLSSDEWGEMRRHPEIGARIVTGAAGEDIPDWVLAHHERPDGRGYPRGLTGDAIPLEARILAVAEAYEAMTTDRAYRQALSPEAANEELRHGAGSQFDGAVVEAFLGGLARSASAPAAR